ncbi:MAG: winged helix-turn-helix transcriptional regulator [Candidatus Thorarchaeota archaeon]|nr:MAG: winged helix-turn-helix transcriptional regulator [Candidatus Thorarchaeota archaeon]
MNINKENKWRADFHKALGNPVRLDIIDFLLDGEQCQCDIFPRIGLAQSTVSAYLTQMVRAGILHVRKDGVRKLYRISDKRVQRMIEQTRKLAQEMVSL